MRGEERVDATKHTTETWKDVRAASDRKELTMPLCGIRAIAKTRGENTRFFAHHRLEGCTFGHAKETPQHRAMKEALARAIDAVPGWRAIIEHPHPSREWIVDVLAESTTKVVRRVAFEVQLSSQTPERYFERSSRYFADSIFPVWVIPRPLEWHRIQVPNVVTGFGKSSQVPGDPGDLLHLDTQHNQIAAVGDDVGLGNLVRALLERGPAWSLGTPAEQAAVLSREEARLLAEEQAREEREVAFEASVEALNRGCSSPEIAYGHHVAPLEGDAFVFATLAGCWKCSNPMLLWWTRTPGWNKHWVKAPSKPELTAALKVKRFENHRKIHRAVEEWMRAVEADVPKALIQLRRTAASGDEYSAFVCPSCEAVFGENFLARIRDEHWSVIAGPEIPAQQPKKQIKRFDGPVPAPLLSVEQQTAGARQRLREQFQTKAPEETEADRAAHTEWLAKDRAYGVSGQERARREQAIIDRAAEKEAFNANPQYIRHGARHICQVCGGFIDDEREGPHKGGDCVR